MAIYDLNDVLSTLSCLQTRSPWNHLTLFHNDHNLYRDFNSTNTTQTVHEGSHDTIDTANPTYSMLAPLENAECVEAEHRQQVQQDHLRQQHQQHAVCQAQQHHKAQYTKIVCDAQLAAEMQGPGYNQLHLHPE
jgi:hypothetical protein